MRPVFLLLILCAAADCAAAAEPVKCDKSELLARLKGAAEIEAPPKLSSSGGAWVARLVLVDLPLATDAFKYDAVVDSASGRAWFVQYGGIAGNYLWFGPVSVVPESLAGCPEVRLAITRSERVAAKSGAQPASENKP